MSGSSVSLQDQRSPSGARQATSHRLVGAAPRWEVAVVSVWFVVLTALAELFPRGGDDWDWGSQLGVDRLKLYFAGLNGRYAGDLMIMGLTRASWFAAFVESAVIVASLVLILAISGNRTPLGYGVVGSLFMLMPLAVWRQSVAWLSGFTNYGIAVLFLLCFIVVAKGDWSRPHVGASRRTVVLLAVAGFVGQLFMENVTLCICALGIAVSWQYRRRHGRWPLRTGVWTAAALVGAAVMFSNSAYRHAVSGAPNYQKVQPGSVKSYAIRLFDYLPTQAVVANIALDTVLALSVIALALIWQRSLPDDHRGRHRRTTVGLAAAFLVMAWTLNVIERHHRLHESERGLAIVPAVVLVVCLATTAVSVVGSASRRWVVLLATAAAVLLNAPLLVVNPVGPRCFYAVYLVLLLAISAVLGEVQEHAPLLRLRLLAVPVHAVGVVVLVIMFVVYGTIARGVGSRLQEVRAAAATGASTVVIRPLPYSSWVHDVNPYWSFLVMRYKAYYGIHSPIFIELKPNPWLRTPTNPHPPAAP